jgi:hypothetical protein
LAFRNGIDVFFRVAEKFEDPKRLQEFQTSGLLWKDVLQEVVHVTDGNTELKRNINKDLTKQNKKV